MKSYEPNTTRIMIERGSDVNQMSKTGYNYPTDLGYI
jgi:hypothetical protein